MDLLLSGFLLADSSVKRPKISIVKPNYVRLPGCQLFFKYLLISGSAYSKAAPSNKNGL